MTDTTDQQAVTVAPIDAALDLIDELYRKYGTELDSADTAIAQAARDYRLASVSSASAEGSEDARKYIASRCDAAEQLGGRSITINTAVVRLAFPEPVPATNQAGEVTLVAALERIALRADTFLPVSEALTRVAWIEAELDAEETRTPYGSDGQPPCRNGYEVSELVAEHAGLLARAALATQPATSQEGEGLRQAFLQTMQGLFLLETAEKLADKFIAIIAATPTPPTLSEDLRVLIGDIAWTADDINGRCGMTLENDDVKLLDEYFAALAQVKAS